MMNGTHPAHAALVQISDSEYDTMVYGDINAAELEDDTHYVGEPAYFFEKYMDKRQVA